MSQRKLKPLHVVNLNSLLEYMSEQFTALNSRLENFVVRRELEVMQKDIDRAHEKCRAIEERVHAGEVSDASHQGEAKGRFTVSEKIGGVFLAVLLAAAIAGLGLR